MEVTEGICCYFFYGDWFLGLHLELGLAVAALGVFGEAVAGEVDLDVWTVGAADQIVGLWLFFLL